jgi:hypothetical protein
MKHEIPTMLRKGSFLYRCHVIGHPERENSYWVYIKFHLDFLPMMFHES